MSCGVPIFTALTLPSRGLFNSRYRSMCQTCLLRNIREVMGGRRCRHAATSPAIRTGIYGQSIELYHLYCWEAALRSNMATLLAWNDVGRLSFARIISYRTAVLFSRIRAAIYYIFMDVVSVQLWKCQIIDGTSKQMSQESPAFSMFKKRT
jgi:hypothetical protein